MSALRPTISAPVAGLMVLACCIPAFAAQPSGTVIAVVQQSEALGQGGRRMLLPEAAVFAGDDIVTGPIGQAQIRFRDDTRLVVGPNSRLTVDAFVFNQDNTARDVTINAVQGAFRFITGASRKDAYAILTPTATIGVRGTEFDFNVDRAGTTSVAVFKGITRVCDKRKRECLEQRAGCSISVVAPNATPKPVVAPAERRKIQRDFRYIQSQNSLLAAFRVDTSSCQILRAALPDSPIVLPLEALTPLPPPPPPIDTGNRSGLGGDGSNPGKGSFHNRSGNTGVSNPNQSGS